MRRVLRPIRLGAVGACLLVMLALVAAPSAAGAGAGARPWMDSSLKPKARAELLLAAMTLEEKVGQMTQAERGAVSGDPTGHRPGGSARCCRAAARPRPRTRPRPGRTWSTVPGAALATRLGIPLLYGVDAVHGHNNLVGATVFPHNIGLGRDPRPALVEQIAHVTAAETRATGLQWIFAPCVCVARDDRWGRTYESFGEDPGLVAKMATAIDGLQGPRARGLDEPDHVLATAKHYAGDGDTSTAAPPATTPSTRASP